MTIFSAGILKGAKPQDIAGYMLHGMNVSVTSLNSQDLGALGEYILEEHEGHDGPIARWFGGSAAALGLVPGSKVTMEAFMRVLEHCDPRDGIKLPNNGGRRAEIPAVDVVLGPEKDLSGHWLVADEKTRLVINEIMHEVHVQTMAPFEKECAVVRRGEDGMAHRSAAGFLAVVVDHTTARPVDGLAAPHLHMHTTIINTALGSDGAWTALDMKRIMDLQTFGGAVAGQIMRKLTSERLGWTWERDEKGIYRDLGFDAAFRDKLSPRQKQIFKEAMERGVDVTNRGVMAGVQRSTREGKAACANEPEAVAWAVELARKMGITEETMAVKRGEAVAARVEISADREWIDANFPPCPEAYLAARDWRGEVARALSTRDRFTPPTSFIKGTSRLDFIDIPPAWDRLRAAMELNVMSREEAIHDALLTVGRMHSTWKIQDLECALLNIDVPQAEAHKRALAYISGDESIKLAGWLDDSSKEVRTRGIDQAVFASVETAEKERMLINAARNGLTKMQPRQTLEQFQITISTLEKSGLSLPPDSDQYAAIKLLMTGRQQLVLVIGQAGTGKSTTMKSLNVMETLAVAFGSNKPEARDGEDLSSDVELLHLVGCTLTEIAAESLHEVSGITAYNTTNLLMRLRSGLSVLAPDSTLIFDESSQGGTWQIAEIWEYVERAGGRMVMIGDPRQLQAIEAGGMYRTLANEVPDATCFLDEIRRQTNLKERAVLASLHDIGLYGQLSDRSIEALTRQGVDKEIDLESLKEGGLEAVRDWMLKDGRIMFHRDDAENLKACAEDYWNGIELAEKRAAEAALRGEEPDPDPAMGASSKSGPEVLRLNRAIIEEGVRRGRFVAETVVEFGGRELIAGQHVYARAIDRKIRVNNGTRLEILGLEKGEPTWKVGLSSPSLYNRSLTVTQGVALGDHVSFTFTPASVLKERARAAAEVARRQQCVMDAIRQLAVARKTVRASALSIGNAETLVAEREGKLAAVVRWADWADALSDDGCVVPMTVATIVMKEATEEHLAVLMDDGTKRFLTKKYVSKLANLDDGYVRTNDRTQSLTTQGFLEYNHATYVGSTRAKGRSHTHLTSPEIDPAVIEQEHTNLAASRTWLNDRIGIEEIDEALSIGADQLRSDASSVSRQLNDKLTLTMGSTPSALNAAIVARVARNHLLGESICSVAATHAMANELSDAIVSELKVLGGETMHPTKIGDRLWITGMPVVVARGEIEGLRHGEKYYITSVGRTRMFVETAGGTRVEVSAKQVREQLDSGFSVTAARARQGVVADESLLVVASGLREKDLTWLGEQTAPVEFFVTDPKVSGEFAQREADEARALEALQEGCSVGTLSATEMLKAQQVSMKRAAKKRVEKSARQAETAAAYVAKLEEQVAKTKSAVAEREAKLVAAVQWGQWAAELPDDGGTTTTTVKSVKKLVAETMADAKLGDTGSAPAWHVVLDTPNPYGIKRVIEHEVSAGDSLEITLSAKRVASERKGSATEVERQAQHLAKAHSRLGVNEEQILLARDREIEALRITAEAEGALAYATSEFVGLAGIQEEIRLTTRAIDSVRGTSPRVVAARDIEQELASLHDRERELTQRMSEISLTNSEEPDVHDEAVLTWIEAMTSKDRINAQLVTTGERYQTVISDLPDDDELVTCEIIESTARHAADQERWEEANELLARYSEILVTSAMRDPRPYHPTLPLDDAVSVKEAQELLHEQLVTIEEYRLRWNIHDPEFALGPEPEDSLQFDDYVRAVRVLDGSQAKNISMSR